MCMMFAATYPERTSALALYGTYARLTRTADYPIGLPPEGLGRFLDRMEAAWGTGFTADYFVPSLASDEQFRQSWARFERLAVSPAGARALISMLYETDARPSLPVIGVPTIIVQREGDRVSRVAGARYMAERIADARYVELPGADHFPWVGDMDSVLDPVEEFLTRTRQEREPDRVLATVLFTDIVGSTERAAALGDRRWRDLLDGYYGLARREVTRFRGREVDTAGDGFFAAFDGPARAVRCAEAIGTGVRSLGIDVRAGLHTGECEVMGDKIGGIAVHIGSRVAGLAGPGEVLVSHTVKDLVAGSGLTFEERGAHTLKGVPGEWRLYAVSLAHRRPGPMTGSVSEQISAAEDHEVAVWRDLAAAAAGHGLLARAEGAWLALAAPGCPIPPFNRVLGIGSRAPAIVDELAEAAAWYAARGIDRYWVQLGTHPIPAPVERWLAAHAFTLAYRSVLLARSLPAPPPARSPTLEVRRVDLTEARAVGRVVAQAFGWPPAAETLNACVVGRPGWRYYLAYREATPMGAGVTYEADGIAWLGFGGVLASHRRLGGQTALLAHRLAGAGSRSHVAIVDTAEDSSSYRNCVRAGFRPLGIRPVYRFAPRGGRLRRLLSRLRSR